MRTTIGGLPLLCTLLLVCSSRADSTNVVGKIEIQGNKVTKDYVIEREIQHPVGVPFDSLLATEDRDRIDNLGIFSDVQFYLAPEDDGTQRLIYHVVETWRILPLPIIFYQEETGWSFGALVMIKNFRGRDEFLQVFGAGGGSDFGGIQFQDPWIVGDHVSLQSHLFFTVYDHPFLPFEYRELDGEVTVGRYFGYQWKIWGTISLEKRWVNYFSGANNAAHRYFQSKLQVIYDTRDVYLDPSRGVMVFSEIQPEIGLDGDSPNNASWEFQGSAYKTVKPGPRKWVAGASLFVHKYFGKSVPYKLFSVGGVESVRGWQVVDSLSYHHESFRTGLNSYYVSAELRQTVIPKHLTRFGTEFGLILAEFADMGSARGTFFDLFENKPIFGLGAGIRFYIPGNMLFRIDYGPGYYDGEWRQPNLHIGIGHKF